MAKLTDSIYNFVEQLLFFQPNTNMLDTSNPVYKVWDNIRNLANIVFVVALFIVIFSQATSIGISNYGIKKMLPRIFAAAVLVNLSYYVCLFGLDVSNIIGAGIDGIIKSVPLSNGAGTSSDTTGASGAVATLGIAALTTTLLASSIAASGGLFAALAGLMVFLPVILMSVLTALVVLVGRQALIILLIIVSPLAFAAMILPNTDKLFASWRKAFTTMLVFYPLVAVLFSGTQVAASVLRLSANGGGVGDQLIKVMSLGVQTFPLFALPFLLKFSGGVLGKVAGVVNNPNKGPFDKMQKGLDARAERTRDNAQSRNLGNFQGKSKRNPGRAAWWQRGSGASASRRAETEWLNQQSKSSAQSRRQSHIGQNLSNLSSGLAQQGAGGRRATEEDIAKAVAAGMEAVNELEAKNLKAGRVVISELGLNEDQKAELANTGRTTGRNGQEIRGELYRAAQISSYAEEGQISRLDTALQNLGSASSSTKKYTVDALGRSYATLKQKGHYLNDEQLKETIRGGGTVSRELLIDAAGRASPELSPQLLSTQDQQAMERTVEAYHTSMSLEGKVKIRAAAKEVKGNRNLQANLVQGDGKSRDIIENYLV